MPGTIKPADFSQRVTDVNRDTWTLDKAEALVAATKGLQVLVETDARTGHAVVGEIVGYATSGSSNPGARLKIRDEFGQTTNYYLPSVGVVVDLAPFGKAKWDAIEFHRAARMAALAEARRRFEAETGIDWMVYPSPVEVDHLALGFGEHTVTVRDKGMRSYEKRVRYTVRLDAEHEVEGVRA